MLKLITLLSLSLAIGTAKLNAQTEKGTLLIGGGATFQATDGASVFLFSPNLGVFFKNNLVAGLQTNVLVSDGISSWSAGPFARYYFGKKEKGKMFGQGTLTISGGGGSDVSLGGGLTGGYAFFLNKNIALELAASYFRIANSGLFVIGAGFQIHFKKKNQGEL